MSFLHKRPHSEKSHMTWYACFLWYCSYWCTFTILNSASHVHIEAALTLSMQCLSTCLKPLSMRDFYIAFPPCYCLSAAFPTITFLRCECVLLCVPCMRDSNAVDCARKLSFGRWLRSGVSDKAPACPFFLSTINNLLITLFRRKTCVRNIWRHSAFVTKNVIEISTLQP